MACIHWKRSYIKLVMAKMRCQPLETECPEIEDIATYVLQQADNGWS
jgi:hypothetical protein